MSAMTLTRPIRPPEPQSPGLPSPGPRSHRLRLAAGTAAVPAARRQVQAAIATWEIPADAETGRGLHLVATLSDEWGFYRTPAGKAVYFMLAFQTGLAPGAGGRYLPGDGEP